MLSAGAREALERLVSVLCALDARGYEVWLGLNGRDRLVSLSIGERVWRNRPLRKAELDLICLQIARDWKE